MSHYEKKSFNERCSDSMKIREGNPGKIPVIIEKISKSDLPNLDKNKYLVPDDFTVAQFLIILRNRMRISHEKSIFLVVKNTIPTSSELMSVIDNRYKNEDGFLYMHYTGENTFGY